VHVDLVTIVVPDHDLGLRFFVDALGFEVADDSPSRTNDGRPKRWVVVRPPGGGTGFVLGRADGPAQEAAVGNQAGGRVSFFLRVDDLDATRARLLAHGVELVGPVRSEEYGELQVFRDPFGNLWDLLGPAR
jgi:catechol 2,3-dioxygenase-like lactoylglutathione lyase family enzyme